MSHTTNLSNTIGWIALATNVVGITPWFYLDMKSPFSPRPFDKAVPEP